jgi:3-deoxy-7-phosphoheptulonate synthase
MQMKSELPASEALIERVVDGREEVKRILAHRDPRLMVVVGPCSIHSREVALDYAARLAKLRTELQDRLAIFMRVYFEKPRTTIGWKGLIFDPYLDGSEDMPAGLALARQIMLDVVGAGLPIGSEMLDPISPQYTAELVSWSAIGARTTESQTHRELASGLSMPVGFKNGTDGQLQVALDAMVSSRHGHCFLGIDQNGMTCVVRTSGNPWGHVVLRGGRVTGPNYDPESIAQTRDQLTAAGFTPPAIMVDCSHANSGKRHEQQRVVLESVVQQRVAGERSLIGVMLESNICAGAQKLTSDPRQLKYGVSITDECMGWEATEAALRWAHAQLAPVIS